MVDATSATRGGRGHDGGVGGESDRGSGGGGGEQLATLLGMVRQIQAQNEQQLIDGRELRGQIAQLITSLPEAYVPRREVEGRFAAQQRLIDDIDKRLVATEEWRIAQTREDGQRLAQFTTGLEQVRGGASMQVSEAQQKHTSAALNYTITALIGMITLLGSYILAHLPK